MLTSWVDIRHSDFLRLHRNTCQSSIHVIFAMYETSAFPTTGAFSAIRAPLVQTAASANIQVNNAFPSDA